MHIDWDNTIVMGVSGVKIDMPSDAKVSIFTDNDLTHINNDYFEINLVALLLNQICIVPVPPLGYDYDNLHANVMNESTPSTSTGATTSAPPFLFTALMYILYLYSYVKQLIYIYRITFEEFTYISFVLLNYECNFTAWY